MSPAMVSKGAWAWMIACTTSVVRTCLCRLIEWSGVCKKKKEDAQCRRSRKQRVLKWVDRDV